MAIIPDDIKNLDGQEPQRKQNIIYEYIKYMREQIEFWAQNRLKDITNLFTRVDDLDSKKMNKSGGTFTGNVAIIKSNNTTESTQSLLTLGNNKSSGTAGASYGGIQLYCDDSHYVFLRPDAGNFSANHSIIFQNSGGTVALTKDYLYSGQVGLSAGKSYAINMPVSFRGYAFTIPLTSGIDAWGIYGLTAQGQSSEAERLKYYKTLIGCSTISFSQSGGSTGAIIVTNSGSYPVTLLWVGNTKLTFTQQ